MRKGRPVVNRQPSLRGMGDVVLVAAVGVVESGGLGGVGRRSVWKNQRDGTSMAAWVMVVAFERKK